MDFDLDDLSTDRSDDSEGIKSLRSALKAANAQIKEKDKTLGEYVQKERSTGLKSLLQSAGVPEVAYGLYPKDAPASEEAVREWVGTYGAAFGIQQAPTQIDPAQVQAMQTMQQASAQAPAPAPGDMNSLLARLQSANSREESQKIYAEFGLKPAP